MARRCRTRSCGNAIAYRKSWFKEVGVNELPEDLGRRRARSAAALKKKGKPYGQTLGHTFGDAPTFAYPLLWSFGGAETDPIGKKVVINSKGAIESVKFMQALLEGRLRRGRAGLGRHEQQPRVPRGRDLAPP